MKRFQAVQQKSSVFSSIMFIKSFSELPQNLDETEEQINEETMTLKLIQREANQSPPGVWLQ